MEKLYECNKDLHMLFIDFKYVYDSINCEQLWIALRNFGIPNKLVRLTQICNEQTYCKGQSFRKIINNILMCDWALIGRCTVPNTV